MSHYLRKVRKAVLLAIEHDVINTAKAAAYSGMLMLFPALLVITTLLAQVQEGTTLVGEMRSVFEQFLPADTMDILQSYLLSRRIYSAQLLLSATGLSIFAGLGMMLSLMRGFAAPTRFLTRIGALAVVACALCCWCPSRLSRFRWPLWSLSSDTRSSCGWSKTPRTSCATSCSSSGAWCVGPLPWPPESPCLPPSTTSVPSGPNTGCGLAGRHCRHPSLVSNYAGLRLVCHPRRRLLHVLRLFRRRHRHPGLALHHRLQCPGRSGVERSSLSRSPGPNVLADVFQSGSGFLSKNQ